MSLLHQFVTRIFLKALLLTLLIICLLVFLGEFTENLRRARFRGGISFSETAYLSAIHIPSFLFPILPLVIYLSGLLFWSRLRAHSQWKGLQSVGVSLKSILIPLSVLSLGLGLLCTLVLSHLAEKGLERYNQSPLIGGSSTISASDLSQKRVFFMTPPHPITQSRYMISAKSLNYNTVPESFHSSITQDFASFLSFVSPSILELNHNGVVQRRLDAPYGLLKTQSSLNSLNTPAPPSQRELSLSSLEPYQDLQQTNENLELDVGSFLLLAPLRIYEAPQQDNNKKTLPLLEQRHDNHIFHSVFLAETLFSLNNQDIPLSFWKLEEKIRTDQALNIDSSLLQAELHKQLSLGLQFLTLLLLSAWITSIKPSIGTLSFITLLLLVPLVYYFLSDLIYNQGSMFYLHPVLSVWALPLVSTTVLAALLYQKD